MNQNKNNTYLLKLWLPAVLITSLLLFGFIFSLKSGDYSQVYIIIGSAFFIIVAKFLLRPKLKNKIDKSLKSENPGHLFKALNDPLKNSMINKQLKESFMTYHKAFVHLIYGEKEVAYQLIEEVDWDSKVPLLQSLRCIIYGLGNYFYEENNLDGLAAIRKAKALATSSKSFPGSNQSTVNYDSYIVVGQILNGIVSLEMIHNLETQFNLNKTPVFLKLTIGWGLANAYTQLDKSAKADEMLNFCKENAPHCKTFHYCKRKIYLIKMRAHSL